MIVAAHSRISSWLGYFDKTAAGRLVVLAITSSSNARASKTDDDQTPKARGGDLAVNQRSRDERIMEKTSTQPRRPPRWAENAAYP